LLETTKLLSTAGVPKGNRLVTFTCSGGDGLLTADLCAKLDLALTDFTPKQSADLRAQLPNFATVSNPLDYNTSLWGHEDLLTRCFTTALSGPCDTGMLIIDYATDGVASEATWDAAVNALLAAARTTGKLAMVTATIPELLPKRVRTIVEAANGAPMQGLEDALYALSAADRFARRKSAVASVGDDEVFVWAPPLVSDGRRILSEPDAKAALARSGLSVPQSQIVSPGLAVKAAEAVGFPVVLKVAEPVIAHKTEAGAVAINLRGADDVARALKRMGEGVAAHADGKVISKVLVERMIEGVVAELIVGVKRDPQFGLALVIGAGGILVELVEDTAILLLPTSPSEIDQAIDSLKIAKLLKGFRGRPAADRAALVKAIAAISAYAWENRDRLLELDVNPLMALKTGAVAVDALIVLSD